MSTDRPGKGQTTMPVDPASELPISESEAAGPLRSRAWQVTPEAEARYQLPESTQEAVLGRGGMGTVFSATDQHLQREVALKELTGQDRWRGSGPRYSPVQVQRFLREARLTGRLEHPNIVPVHEVGVRSDGTLYFTMRRVHGRTLKEAMVEATGLQGRLALLPHFVDVCQAVAYAHAQGVVHRDIKPGNVMIGEFGQTVVLDWGLARMEREPPEETPTLDRLPAGPDLTVDGVFMGTPAYASPEQARGDLDHLDARSDVWSLGAVLFELLTGAPPFLGPPQAVLDAISDPERPVPPVVMGPADLASICAKCLARDPDQRYPSAAELAAEVEAFLAGRLVDAHDYTPWEHLAHFARQQRPLLLALSLVLVTLVVSLVVAGSSWVRERDARQLAQEAQAQERQERLVAELNLARAHLERSDRLMAEGRYLGARALAASSLAHNPLTHPEAQELALLARSRIHQARHTSPLEADTLLESEVEDMVDLSVAGDRLAVVDRDGRARVWHQGEVRALPIHPGGAWAVALSEQGRVATGGVDGSVCLHRVQGQPPRCWPAHEGAIFDLAWLPSGQLASVGEDGWLREWSGPDQPGRQVHASDQPLHGVAVVQGLVATAGRDEVLRLWPAEGEPLELPGHTRVIRGVALSRDGGLVATASYDRTARVWDTATGELVSTLEGHGDEVLSVAFSPDSRWVATASWDRSLRLFDARTGALLLAVKAHDGALWGVGFHSDGSLWTAGEDGRIRRWVPTRASPTLHTPGQDYVWTVAWSPDGERLAVGGADGAVRTWTRQGVLLHTLLGSPDLVTEVGWSPDGQRLAAACYDGRVRLWDATTGQPLGELDGFEGMLRSLSWSPDGQHLAAGGQDGVLRTWDQGLPEHVIPVGHHIRRVRYSPDGTLLASGDDSGHLGLYSASTGQPLQRISVDETTLYGLDWSGDGRLLTTASWSGLLARFDTTTWQRQAAWGAGSGLFGVHTTLPGPRSATVGDDTLLTVWEADGTPLLRLDQVQSNVAVAFSPDGRTLALADSEVVRLLPVELEEGEPEQWLAEAEAAWGWKVE